ncbi:ArsR/SmtB family transcription factor [Lysinibacillus sp. NPDC097231]|uniref:ArsR/SmtB family transcription factor n=1 Tax=Lysinibacillus sp. NPDC097231 TaxID=3364142 RepID=UPI0037F70FA1
MKYHYSPQPTEKISLQVESSPVWEVILGIAGYTHVQLRHTFDFDEEWTFSQQSMSESLIESLKLIEKTNFWYSLIMLQNELSSLTVEDFVNQLHDIPVEKFYGILLPYKNRETESMRRETAARHNNPELFEEYAAHFDDHDYLGEYIRNLSQYSHQELCELFSSVLNKWYNWVSQQEKWEKWMQALNFEEKRYQSLDVSNPMEEIEHITGGVKYQIEPSIWTVKLIPHISYRPWILEKRSCDTKLFFYPLKEELLLEPGVPPRDLVRSYKALGDELRLKLLYQLLRGPLSLQELSAQFNINKTTLHHQLSLLKAARLIKVDKGIYSGNPIEIDVLYERLTQYLRFNDEEIL